MTAVPGLCAFVSCNITCPEAKPIKSFLLFKCAESDKCTNRTFTYKKTEADTEPETNQIKMLEPDLKNNNCSFIIKSITAENGGEYEITVEDALSQKHTIPPPRFKIIIQGNVAHVCTC